MEAEDIFNHFPEFFYRSRKNIEKIKNIGNSEFQNIYDILSDQSIPIDKIALMTKTSIREVIQKVTLMEIEGIVVHEIGKGFKLKGE